MIQIIGIKRLVILILFISINIILGAAIYLYMIPESENSQRRLRSLRGQVASTQLDIDRMHIEFEQLDKQQDKFNKLKESGFFSTQIRSDAKELLRDIQNEANVISAVVSVKSGVIVDYTEAKKINHKVLLSPLEIKIKAFDDASIYRYLDIAVDKFPGHLSLDEIMIQRTRDVSAPVLRAIASGANPELVNASIRMSWRTVIPESQVILDQKSQ